MPRGEFAYDVHHIIPHEVFRDDDLRDFLDGIFDPESIQITEDAIGNKIALFVNGNSATSLLNSSILSPNFGQATHGPGGHKGYNEFVTTAIRGINSLYESGSLSREQAVDKMWQFQRILSEMAKSGAPPIMTPEDSTWQDYSDSLLATWDQYQINNALSDSAVQARIDKFRDEYKIGVLDVTQLDANGNLIESYSNIEFRTQIAYEQAKWIVDADAADRSAGGNGLIQYDQALLDLSNFIQRYDAQVANKITPNLTDNGQIFFVATYWRKQAVDNGEFVFPDYLAMVNTSIEDDVQRITGVSDSFADTFFDVAKNFVTKDDGFIDFARLETITNAFTAELRAVANGSDGSIRSGVLSGALGAAGGVLGDIGDFFAQADTQVILQDAFETDDFGAFWDHAGEYVGETIVFNLLIGGAIAGVAAAGFPILAGALALGVTIYGVAELAAGLIELYQNEELRAAALDWAGDQYDEFKTWAGEQVDALVALATDVFGPNFFNQFLTSTPLGLLIDLGLDGVAAFLDYIISPLVIDLDGDGVELVSLGNSSAYFDLNLDGFAELTGWVSPDDALLAFDVDGDGIIDDNSELFGNQTGQANGFLALSQYDSNSDGVIDVNDAVFSDLILWQDLDGDGVSDDGEMMSLTDAGIISIDLGYSDISETNAGHDVLQRSTVTFADGSTTTIDDVYFQTDTRASVALLPDGFEYNEDVFKLPALFGYGQIASTWVALSQDVDLRQEATDLVTLASSGDITGFINAFEDFVLAWAGVDGVDPTSRGAFIDARHLEFLERAYGSSYDQLQGGASTVQSDPLHLAGPPLEAQYEQLIQRLAARFLAQVATSSALLNAASAAEFDALLESNLLSSMTDLLVGYSPASRSLAGEIDTLFADLVAAIDAGTLGLDDAAAVLHLIQIDLEPDLAIYQADIAALAATLGTATAEDLSAVIQAYTGEEYVAGGAGIDNLDNTTSGFFYGAEGDDTITGSELSDTYFYMSGDGSDIISDFAYNGGTPPQDRLVFGDLNASDLSFVRLGNDDLLITMPDGATVTIVGHFTNGQTMNIEEVEFADGTVLDSQAIRDKSVADQKASGYVLGSTKMENYYHAQGDGSYSIEDEYGLSSINDRLVFTDVNPDEVSFSRGAGTDLVITLPNGEAVTIVNQFQWGNNFDIELIEFADGTVLNAQDIRDRTVADMKSSGSVIGSMEAETYVHTTGDGSYTILDNGTLSSIDDRLVFTDLNEDQVLFSQGAGDDLVITTNTGETITIISHFSNGGNYDIEEFEFADGTVVTSFAVTAGVVVSGSAASDNINFGYTDSNGDAIDGSGQILMGFDGNDQIRNGAGDDSIFGGDGTDWLFSGGGADAFDGGEGTDFVTYEDVTQGLTIDMTNAANSTGEAFGDTFVNIERLEGSNLDDIIILAAGVYGYGLEGNDTIYDGGARESLIGGNGQDVFVFGAADGQRDQINDYTRGDDLIDLSAWGVSDFSQLTITTVATNDPNKLHVDIAYGVEVVRLFKFDAADVANLSAADFVLATAPATAPDLFGTASADVIDSGFVDANGNTLSPLDQVIYAGAGNDVIKDGDGNDTVYGEDGRDTFYAGDGADYYDGGADIDTVRYRDIGTGLTIDMTNAANSTGVAAGDTFTSIEKIQGTNYDDIIFLAAGVNGEGWGGNDIIYDNTGAESMNGGAGADTFVFVAGDGYRDQITGFEEGIDLIDISAWGASEFGDLTINIVALSNGTEAHVDISYNGEELRLHKLSLADVANIDASDFVL